MGQLKQMTGTVWHIEKMVRKEGDDRRHKTRCVYFNHEDQICIYRAIKCPGSAHCRYYKGRENTGSFEKNVELIIEDRQKQSDADHSPEIRVDSIIQHVINGFGIVKKVDGNAILVRFEGGKEAKLDIKTCLKNKLIVIIKQ